MNNKYQPRTTEERVKFQPLLHKICWVRLGLCAFRVHAAPGKIIFRPSARNSWRPYGVMSVSPSCWTPPLTLDPSLTWHGHDDVVTWYDGVGARPLRWRSVLYTCSLSDRSWNRVTGERSGHGVHCCCWNSHWRTLRQVISPAQFSDGHRHRLHFCVAHFSPCEIFCQGATRKLEDWPWARRCKSDFRHQVPHFKAARVGQPYGVV